MNHPILLMLLLSSCFQMEIGNPNDSGSEKILIVFLSRTNNTKTVAEIIHKKVGGDLVALELENPYPKDYRAIVEQVASENESGFLPPLKTKVDTDRYDTIFIGFPTWGMQLPPPMKSFLHDHDLSGKTIVPFNTNGGYGLGSTVQTVRKLCPDSEILQEFSVRGGSERDGIYLAIQGDRKVGVEAEVEAWLKEIQLRDNSDISPDLGPIFEFRMSFTVKNL